MSESAQAPAEQTETPIGREIPLPDVVVPLAPNEVVARLDVAARRGRLAGFEAVPGAPGVEGSDLFFADAFGGPYDGVLIAMVATRGEKGTTLAFRWRTKPVLPWVIGVVLVLTAWPGVIVTESMLATMVPGWEWLWRNTWWWYLPLTVPFIPWVMWSTLRKSRAAIHDSSHRTIVKVARELGGHVVPVEAMD